MKGEKIVSAKVVEIKPRTGSFAIICKDSNGRTYGCAGLKKSPRLGEEVLVEDGEVWPDARYF